jgi:hypothetical protein
MRSAAAQGCRCRGAGEAGAGPCRQRCRSGHAAERALRGEASARPRCAAAQRRGASACRAGPGRAVAGGEDPHRLLNVPRGASREEARAAAVAPLAWRCDLPQPWPVDAALTLNDPRALQTPMPADPGCRRLSTHAAQRCCAQRAHAGLPARCARPTWRPSARRTPTSTPAWTPRAPPRPSMPRTRRCRRRVRSPHAQAQRCTRARGVPGGTAQHACCACRCRPAHRPAAPGCARGGARRSSWVQAMQVSDGIGAAVSCQRIWL